MYGLKQFQVKVRSRLMLSGGLELELESMQYREFLMRAKDFPMQSLQKV